MRTFGVGIIGFGSMGRRYAYAHVNLPLFRDPPPCRTRLVGVATPRRETVENAVFLTVWTKNGAPGHIEASRIAARAVAELRFEVNGSRGALRFNPMEPNYLRACDATLPAAERGWRTLATVQSHPAPAAFPSPKASVGWLRGQAACLHNSLSAVARGEPADPSLQVGVDLQYLMAEALDRAGRC